MRIAKKPFVLHKITFCKLGVYFIDNKQNGLASKGKDVTIDDAHIELREENAVQ